MSTKHTTSEAPPDPWGAVLRLGRRQVRIGTLLGLIGGLLVHGAAAGRGLAINDLLQLRIFASHVQADMYSRLQATLDIEVDEVEPEPEEEPEVQEPEAVEEPTPITQPPPKEAAPAPAAPPAAAQAAKVLTSEPDPNAPLDLTGDVGFVTGNASTYAGGYTAATGRSKKAVYDKQAKPSGVIGGTGKAKTSVAQGPDLSRPAGKPRNFRCTFTPEAEAAQITFMRVSVLVQIDAQGHATGVKLTGSDPGFGLGRRARQCALRNRYPPALDRNGKPTPSTLPMIVRFQTR